MDGKVIKSNKWGIHQNKCNIERIVKIHKENNFQTGVRELADKWMLGGTVGDQVNRENFSTYIFLRTGWPCSALRNLAWSTSFPASSTGANKKLTSSLWSSNHKPGGNLYLKTELSFPKKVEHFQWHQGGTQTWGVPRWHQGGVGSEGCCLSSLSGDH